MIHGLLTRNAQGRPEAPLVEHRGVTLSYGHCEAAANRLAHLLAGHGIRPGDRVALLLPNSAAYLVAYFAALKVGALVVPLHADSDARSLGQVLASCEPRAVITGKIPAGRLAGALEAAPDVLVLGMDEAPPDFPVPWIHASQADALPAEAPDVVAPDQALIIFTSGSTGSPRGAVLTHRGLLANTEGVQDHLQLTPADRGSVLLPFPYVYGTSVLHAHLAAGAGLMLHDSLMFPNRVLDEMEAAGVTGLAGVPSTFAILLTRSDLASRPLPALRYLTQAGGAMPDSHIRRLLAAQPDKRLFIMYGATEASARLTMLPPEELPGRVGWVGRAIRNVEIQIRRADGTVAPAGQEGEITATGPCLMEGYWQDPEATLEVLRDGRLYTGDQGRMDAEGCLQVTGRLRELIKSGAHRISPGEVEAVLVGHPAVEEAVVVGVPDEILGERIHAWLTSVPGAAPDSESVELHCRQRLPAHKVPREYGWRREMPRSPAGKIDRRQLRREAMPANPQDAG